MMSPLSEVLYISGISPYYCCFLVAKSCLTLETPGSVAHQALLSMEIPRQEYWNGEPFLSPGDLPDPGIEPAFPAWQVDSLPLSHGEAVGPYCMETKEARRKKFYHEFIFQGKYEMI